MSNVESAACWARDTPLGRLSLLVLHDGRCAGGRARIAGGRTKDRTEQRGKRRNQRRGDEDGD